MNVNKGDGKIDEERARGERGEVSGGMDEERFLVEALSGEVIDLLSENISFPLPLIEVPMTINGDEFLFPGREEEVCMIPYPRDYMLVSYIHFLSEREKKMEEGLSPLSLLTRFMEDRDQIDGENFCLYLKKGVGGTPFPAGGKASLYYRPRKIERGKAYWMRGTLLTLHGDDLYTRFARVLLDLLIKEWKETSVRYEWESEALRFHVDETKIVSP